MLAPAVAMAVPRTGPLRQLPHRNEASGARDPPAGMRRAIVRDRSEVSTTRSTWHVRVESAAPHFASYGVKVTEMLRYSMSCGASVVSIAMSRVTESHDSQRRADVCACAYVGGSGSLYAHDAPSARCRGEARKQARAAGGSARGEYVRRRRGCAEIALRSSDADTPSNTSATNCSSLAPPPLSPALLGIQRRTRSARHSSHVVRECGAAQRPSRGADGPRQARAGGGAQGGDAGA